MNLQQDNEYGTMWLILFSTAFLGLFVLFLYAQKDISNMSIQEKEKAIALNFEKGISYICKGTYDKHSVKYCISKSNKWSIYKHYFKKEDLLIDTSMCEKE